jgi:hypothetical protein
VRLVSIALLRLGDAPSADREALREHHRLAPGAGVVPIRDVVAVVRGLGADPPARLPGPDADAAGWARRLRQGALGVTRDPQLAPSR